MKIFNGVVEEAFAGLKTDSCTLIPLPPSSIADRVQEVAKQTVDASKLKAFSAKYSPSVQALAKTDSAICLPAVEKLNKLALAQAEVGRAFDFKATRSFFAYTVPMLKGEAKLTDETFSLLVGAQSQAQDASFKDKKTFQDTLKKLESASKKEKEKQALARAKVDAAAALAAKKAATL